MLEVTAERYIVTVRRRTSGLTGAVARPKNTPANTPKTVAFTTQRPFRQPSRPAGQ